MVWLMVCGIIAMALEGPTRPAKIMEANKEHSKKTFRVLPSPTLVMATQYSNDQRYDMKVVCAGANIVPRGSPFPSSSRLTRPRVIAANDVCMRASCSLAQNCNSVDSVGSSVCPILLPTKLMVVMATAMHNGGMCNQENRLAVTRSL